MTTKELKQQIKMLKKEIVRLQDENASLWFLLDELDKSNVSNSQYKQNFEAAFKELRKSISMTTTKVGKA